MKQFFTRLGLACLLATVGLSGNAADPIFNFTFDTEADFTDNFDVTDGNTDGTKWEYCKYTTGSVPYYYAKCYYWQAYAYNDSMTTKQAFSLLKGHAYKLTFDGWADSTTGECTLAVGYHPSEESTNIQRIHSNKTVFINKYNGENPPAYECVFEVPEDGDYKFIFMAIGSSSSGGACVDNIMLVDGGSPMTPAEVSALSASAAADFSPVATLSITLPSKTITGSDLPADGISKVEIFRGDELVGTITSGLTPGSEISWPDNAAAEGMNSYKVIVYNGELASAPVETSVYVGPLTPLAPTQAKAEKAEGGKIKISWTAPVMSTADIALDSSLLSYSISRTINEGEPVELAAALTETEYEDTYSSDELTTLIYTVTAHYGTKASEPTTTNSVKIGTYDLPFEESFANAVLPDDWEITTGDTGSSPKKWRVLSAMEKQPNAAPYDEDGGLLTYNSYNAYTTYWSQAITPEIKMTNATAPILEFMFYHSGSQSANDRVVIEISEDGADFAEMPDSEIKRNNGTTGWTLYQFPLNAYKDANSIRISFKAISGYGADMAIDAIRIYNGMAYDLEAVSLEAPASVKTGADGEFKLTVKNSAFADIAAADYTINVYAEGEVAKVIDGQDIAAGESKEFEFIIPTHAGHVENGIPVYCEIVFANDEEPDNNISQEIIVSVEAYQAKAVTSVTGSVSGNTLTLTWPEIEIENYKKMESAITLDREEDMITKDEYDEDHSIAYPATFTASDGKVWQNIDKDGEICGDEGFPGVAKAFMYTSRNMRSSTVHKDYSGEDANGMLVAIAPKAEYPIKAASDYIVSPELPGDGMHTLEFHARAFTNVETEFYVEYTEDDDFTTDNIEEKFIPIGDKITIKSEGYELKADTWRDYSIVIPSTAKYVAIHFVGKSTYSDQTSLCLDDIRLTSEPFSKPTYNVYYREYPGTEEQEAEVMRVAASSKAPQKHNAEAIEEAEYVLSVPTASTDFHVSAVYPQGETELSPAYRHDIITIVDEIETESSVSVKVCGREITATSNGKAILISVYAVYGSILANEVEKFVPAVPGAYVVKAGDKAVTVMVK